MAPAATSGNIPLRRAAVIAGHAAPASAHVGLDVGPQLLALPVASPAPPAGEGKPRVCLVIGAGAGIGSAVGRRFARAGYVTCLVRRTGKEGLDALVQRIEGEGGRAVGHILDATKPGSIEGLVAQVEADIGPIHIAVYNLGAQLGNRPLQATSSKDFEMGWRLGCEGLFRLAKAVTPSMVARGSGTLLVTSATAAVRGNAGQHSHASAMAARRMLCQTLNHEFMSKGLHICHIVVDSMVDAPDTLGKMVGADNFAKLKESIGEDGIVQPDQVAETYFHLASQHRSTWTFEMDLRTFRDTPWWNH